MRPGYNKMGQIAANTPISTMIPFYGGIRPSWSLASGGKFYDPAGAQMSAGPYGSDDWSWMSFANLSDVDYTVMVNGVNGVWSWDGTTFVKEAVDGPVGRDVGDTRQVRQGHRPHEPAVVRRQRQPRGLLSAGAAEVGARC